MSNKSIFISTAIGVRATDYVDNELGINVSGIYTPKHSLPDGRIFNARFNCDFFINNANWEDGSGQVHQRKNFRIPIVAWNGSSAKAGKGLADLLAKGCSPGKELNSILGLKTFEKQVWDKITRVPLTHSDGSNVMEEKIQFLLTGQFSWGADSDNQIKREISMWNPTNPNPFTRPPRWNDMTSPDFQIWTQQVIPTRKAMYYQGGGMFGYCKVSLPRDATIIYDQPEMQNNFGAQTGQQQQQQQQQQVWQNNWQNPNNQQNQQNWQQNPNNQNQNQQNQQNWQQNQQHQQQNWQQNTNNQNQQQNWQQNQQNQQLNWQNQQSNQNWQQNNQNQQNQQNTQTGQQNIQLNSAQGYAGGTATNLPQTRPMNEQAASMMTPPPTQPYTQAAGAVQ